MTNITERAHSNSRVVDLYFKTMGKYCDPLFIVFTLLHYYTLIRQYSLMDFSGIKIEDQPTPLILDDLSLNNSVVIYISSAQMSSI